MSSVYGDEVGVCMWVNVCACMHAGMYYHAMFLDLSAVQCSCLLTLIQDDTLTGFLCSSQRCHTACRKKPVIAMSVHNQFASCYTHGIFHHVADLF